MSFDWALKTVLRDKANFDVLEGFLSALLKQDVVVEELLESESNRLDSTLKSNRVDLLVKMASGERVVIEVQYRFEPDFIKRLLYGVSKVVVENLEIGQDYGNVKKVISVSIVHFDIGFHDSDYVYHGTMEFRGIHTKHLMVKENSEAYRLRNRLELESEAQQSLPEYYIIPIKHFNDVVGDDLDEWIYALKHNEVPDTFKSRNIQKMREKLNVLNLTPADRKLYENFWLRQVSDEAVLNFELKKGREEGLRIGRKEGHKEGHKEGRKEGHGERSEEIARNLLDVLPDDVIAEKVGLTIEQVIDLRKEVNERGEV